MSAKQGLGIGFALALALAVGWFGRGFQVPSNAHRPLTPDSRSGVAEGSCPDGTQPLYWVAPMDPNFIRDEPGKSPMGMDLVPKCSSDTAGSAEGQVKIDSTVLQNIGVRIERVERRDLDARHPIGRKGGLRRAAGISCTHQGTGMGREALRRLRRSDGRSAVSLCWRSTRRNSSLPRKRS